MLDVLAFWYQVIVASEALLEEAGRLLDTDGWEGDLQLFYAQHLEDERHHAQWLREDLGNHPIALDFAAAEIAGTAYYLIRHVHPVALIGYMQALEGRAIPMELVEAVELEHGVQAARTLRLHAEEDPNHIKELNAFPIPNEWKALVDSTRVQTLQQIERLRCRT